jgi:NADPH:quinone reductase
MASQAWFVEKYGGPERLVLRPREDPSPGTDEVLVRTAAIGLNFADLFVRAGVYPRTPKPPLVPGMELSGVVERVGAGVTDLREGERVVAVPIFGGHAEKVVAPATHVFPVPAGVALEEAAAVPVVFLTAHWSIEKAQVEPGERVVVTAAAGGVGTALLQLLVRRGARVLALAGSEPKLALCRELGAEAAGTYSEAERLIAERFGGSADVAMDAVGGRIFRRLWKRLDGGGRYVLFGLAAAAGGRGVAPLRALREAVGMGLLIPFRTVETCRTLIGFNLSLLPQKTGALREAAAAIFADVAAGRLRPILGPRFPFEKLPDAHRALASRATTGKVIVTVP